MQEKKRDFVVHTGGIDRNPTFKQSITTETTAPSVEEIDKDRKENPGPLGQPPVGQETETVGVESGDTIQTGEIPAPKEGVKKAEDEGRRTEETVSEPAPLGDDRTDPPGEDWADHPGEPKGEVSFLASKRLDESTNQRTFAELDAKSKADLEALAKSEGVVVKGTGSGGTVTKADLIKALRTS